LPLEFDKGKLRVKTATGVFVGGDLPIVENHLFFWIKEKVKTMGPPRLIIDFLCCLSEKKEQRETESIAGSPLG